MKKISKLSSVFGYLALTSGSIWFGTYIARLLTTYQMFEETEFVLKNYITDTNLSAIFQTTFPLVNATFYSYIVMIFTFTLFLILSRLKLKDNGWLLIVALIIYLTLPLESCTFNNRLQVDCTVSERSICFGTYTEINN